MKEGEEFSLYYLFFHMQELFNLHFIFDVVYHMQFSKVRKLKKKAYFKYRFFELSFRWKKCRNINV